MWSKQEHAALGIDPAQKALMIWDVFKGQMTDVVKHCLAESNIFLVEVPANMTQRKTTRPHC